MGRHTSRASLAGSGPAANSLGLFNHPGRIYVLSTAGFFACVAVLAVLESFGVPNAWLGYGFVALMIAFYAVLGVLARTSDVGAHYVAGRTVPPVYSGMAAGADWISGASFLAMGGALVLLGYDGLAFVLGWTGGFVLVAVLIAPYLRELGVRSVPDFFAERFGSTTARLLAVIVLVVSSFLYLVAQLHAAGLVASLFFGTDFKTAVYVGLAFVLVCAMVGDMRSVVWARVAQYIVLVVAFLLPVTVLSLQRFDLPLPQLTYGEALDQISRIEHELLSKGLADARTLKLHTRPFTATDPLNFFALTACLMVGTAALPHLLQRYFAASSSHDARSSVTWTLFFVFLFFFSVPAFAAFAKLELFTLIGNGISLGELPQWILAFGKVGLAKVCGVDAVSAQAVTAACGKISGHPGVLRWQDLGIDTDAVVLAMPAIAGLPYWIAGLVAAGGLIAVLSTADRLLLGIANAFSQDIYQKAVRPNASPRTRLLVSRLLLLLVAFAAAYAASARPADILTTVAWSFSIVAAGLFPALVLGIWWRRTSAAGAILGMLLGFAVTAYYLVGTRYFAVSFHETWGWLGTASPPAIAKFNVLKQAYLAAGADAARAAARWAALDAHAQTIAGWWGVRNVAAGVFGLPVGFVTIIIVSLLSRPREMRSAGSG